MASVTLQTHARGRAARRRASVGEWLFHGAAPAPSGAAERRGKGRRFSIELAAQSARGGAGGGPADRRAGADALTRSTELVAAAQQGSAVKLERLLKGVADPNSMDAAGVAALHAACATGQKECVRRLLEASADPDLCTADGWRQTSLHVAAARGSAACARLLLLSGADPTATRADGHTPHSLVEALPPQARPLTLALELELAAKEWRRGGGAGGGEGGGGGVGRRQQKPALVLAAAAGRRWHVQELLQGGADPDSRAPPRLAPPRAPSTPHMRARGAPRCRARASK